MNRRLLSVTVFLALMLTSLLAGRHNYHVTRNEITADLNQALALTLLEKKEPPYAAKGSSFTRISSLPACAPLTHFPIMNHTSLPN
jgi:hypothetical protein